ncbi:MAG: hypothetical protein QF393_16815 [Rhodospirillales bacterium]|nr:hypothetical protein [Rhodospirillales bacterium]
MQYSEAAQLFKNGYLPIESGYQDLGDGKKLVAAYTRMPGCRAKMVDWWFGWVTTTEQYKLWHPRDHLFSDWEGREDGDYVGAAHLVHEYLAGDDGPIYKLRISFTDAHEFFGGTTSNVEGIIPVCANIGDLEKPVDFGKMTHFVRDTDYGCEMRSRFWLGEIESRDPAVEFGEEEKREMRQKGVTDELAWRLHQHATEEMGYLSEILPVLYRHATGDDAFVPASVS